ncbi:hypothetical protein TBLA_0B03940 [Henningerozyma blattae CBS 6284]|uniref:Dihydrofolate reductase n=1 Tax=Henningerozyma blattae (strain ATCC 34711 / CBS 6284 / DSM 70876 / NBRC 10599 / NRRL Y-10934 / UCD 77-7) TaxID=1071380 RepID=I2GYN0_HENB6|nr:hypothetical protein TBLA_0B03940 [Tetrapisispora blattae CBS 6284]CCH59232.1 hypothetical protein TBLA_0B03940 [Tetrapisispora blattae CBS 6284]
MNNPKIPVINVVACLMPSYGIGYQGKLPWRLKQEMAYFKQLTTNTRDPTKQNAVVMGRRTWESIPSRFRPLPSRLNVVVSRGFDTWATRHVDESNPLSTYIGAPDLRSAITTLQQRAQELRIERIYVMGGAQIYQAIAESGLLDHWLLTAVYPLDGTPEPPMDTWLTAPSPDHYILQTNEQQVRDFLPPSLDLLKPNPSSADNPITKPKNNPNCGVFFVHSEKGYAFGITLYDRRRN